MFCRISAVFLPSLIMLLFMTSSVVTQTTATGGFTITIQGFLVTGELVDVTGHQSGVRLLMSIDQTFSVPMGTVHIVGTGVWNGATADSMIMGSIDDVNGSVHACVLLVCQDAVFTGNGNWNGTVTAASSGLQGSGTFHGFLSFPNLSPPKQAPVSGNWTSTLNL